MHLELIAVARKAAGAEFDAATNDYLKRASGLARPLGLKGPASRLIPPEKGNNPAKEAEQLKAALRGKAVLLDERGAMSSSPEIAALIAKCRDEGTKELSFCIGGAHGFTDELRREVKAEGGAILAFGRAVWPHALCRVMLAEQIYRALAILAGHPYHRL